MGRQALHLLGNVGGKPRAEREGSSSEADRTEQQGRRTATEAPATSPS